MCLCNLLKYKKKNKESEYFFFQNVDQKNLVETKQLRLEANF